MFVAFLVACVVIALGAAVLGNVYDITLTVRGIKAGVAVEGNTWLVGQTPTARALYLRDAILFVPFALCPAVLVTIADCGPAMPLIVVPVIYGVKHYLGGRRWATLLHGGKITEAQTAWQKFLS